MKKLIFAAILTCLALNVRAQQTLQVDSTSPLWQLAINPSHGGVAADYLAPDTSWGAGSDVGRMISIDGANNWSTISRYIPNGLMVMRSAHEGYIFNYSALWIYKTMNAWQTWDSVPFPPMNGFNSGCIADSLHAFICGGNDIGRTSDGGNTWTKTPVPGFVGWIGFANPSVGYAVGGDPGYAFKTTDSGNSWHLFTTSLSQGATGIAAINAQTVIIAGFDSVYRTTDGGVHWKTSTIPSLTNFTGQFLGLAMHGATGYIVGDDALILRTSDSGQTWVQEASGLSGNISLYDAIVYDDSIASCGNDGGILLVRKSTLSDVQQTQRDSLTISEFPNPAQNEITIQYTLPQTQHVTLLLYDPAGRLVASILNGVAQSSGLQTVQVSTNGLANGAYFFQFSSESYTSTGSLTIQQ